MHNSLDGDGIVVIDLPRLPTFVSQQEAGVKRLVAATLLRLIERRDSDDATLAEIDADEQAIVQLVQDFGKDLRPAREILADCNLAAALLPRHRPVAEHLALVLLGGSL